MITGFMAHAQDAAVYFINPAGLINLHDMSHFKRSIFGFYTLIPTS